MQHVADRDRLALAGLDASRIARLWPRRPPVGGAGPAGEAADACAATGADACAATGADACAATGADAGTMLDALVETLRAWQHSCVCVDLTRPRFGLPVVVAAAPGLQPFPAAHVAPRLAEAMRAAPSDASEPSPGSEPEAPLF
ncbi:MAG: hypothetical protein AAF907_01710 [Planctomycetota bacterium]